MGVPRKLTLTLAVLMTAQSLAGLMAPEQYRDVEWIKATWYGNGWLTLIVAVSLLLTSRVVAGRGSARAVSARLGYLIEPLGLYQKRRQLVDWTHGA